MNNIEYRNRITSDKDFRDQLRKDAKSALQKIGVDTGNTEITVVEDTATVHHIAMPSPPGAPMDESALDGVVGGGWNPFRSSGWKDVGKAFKKIEHIKDVRVLF